MRNARPGPMSAVPPELIRSVIAALLGLASVGEAGLARAQTGDAGLAAAGPSGDRGDGSLAEPSAGVEGAMKALRGPGGTFGSRRDAARRLLEHPDPRALAGLQETLEAAIGRGADSTSVEAARATATAVGQMASAPPRLLAPLQRMASEPVGSEAAASAQAQAAAVGAIGAIRTRPALRALVSIAGDASRSQEVVGTAFRALARCSGRDDIEPTAAAWSAWIGQVEWLTEAEWRRVLAESLAAQADRAVETRNSAVGQLVEYVRREFDAAAVEDRGRLLEKALRGDVPGVRRLGFDLAMGELANSRGLDPRVARAALDLLNDRDVGTRRSAAELLNVTAPPEFAGRIADRLSQEADPRTAAWLLRIAARQPAVSVLPAVLRWLPGGEPVVGPAIEAAGALHERGWIQSAVDRAQVLAVLRAQPLEKIRPEGARLRFALGDESDRTSVLQGVMDLEPDRRTIIGNALAQEPSAMDMLLEAAGRDRALVIPAIRALGLHKPLAWSYEQARRLAGPLDDAERTALIELTSRLSSGQLLAAARGEEDLDLREAMLARLTTEPLVVRAGVSGRDRARITYTQHPSVIAGLLMLAQTRLELRQPALALGALDALAPMSQGLDPAERDGLRTVALVWLGRVDEATSLNAPAEAWCSGLEKIADMRHADSVADVIVSRFGDGLSESLRSRIDAVRRRMSEFMGPRMAP